MRGAGGTRERRPTLVSTLERTARSATIATPAIGRLWQTGLFQRPRLPYFRAFLNNLIALAASSALSKAKYATLFRPRAAAERPRKLMPASASARVILVPSPGRSGPSTLRD